MSNRKMKLALTVGLLNRKTGEGNTLQLVKRLMNKFRSDVGGFLGMRQLEEQILNRSHTLQSFALDFEHYTLNLDIVNNRRQYRVHQQAGILHSNIHDCGLKI